MGLPKDRIAKAAALAEPSPMRGIKLINLETACCVARLGTLTAAAQLLCTTQPAVSARIRELEDSLGMKLFRRQKFGVELTDEGRDFLAEVEPLLLRLQQVSTSVRRRSSAASVIRLGNGSPCLDWLPLMVREFQARTPLVRFDIKTEHTNALLHKIELRALDVGIAAGPIDASRFHSVSVGFDRMLWVTSARDPHLALDLNAYLSKVFVWCGPTDSFYWPTVMREVLQLGVAPDRLNHIASMLEAKAMVLAGCGISLISETLVRAELEAGDMVCVPQLQAGGAVQYSMVCRRDESLGLAAEIFAMAVRLSTLHKELP